MKICNGCGGIAGRDCFNPEECEWIARDQQARANQLPEEVAFQWRVAPELWAGSPFMVQMDSILRQAESFQGLISASAVRETILAYAAPVAQALPVGIEKLLDALTDARDGWKYIRHSHGDLYGVGWDRTQAKLESAIAAVQGEKA